MAKERNNMGGMNMAEMKRMFKKKQEKSAKASKDTEKNQAKREIKRLKSDSKKGGLAHKGNIEDGIKRRKEKHGIK